MTSYATQGFKVSIRRSAWVGRSNQGAAGKPLKRPNISGAAIVEPVSEVELVFDAVMVRNDGLTESSILSYAGRQYGKKASQ